MAQMNLKKHAAFIGLAVAALLCIVASAVAFAVRLRGADLLMGVVSVILILLAWADFKETRARDRAQEKPFTTTDDTH